MTSQRESTTTITITSSAKTPTQQGPTTSQRAYFDPPSNKNSNVTIATTKNNNNHEVTPKIMSPPSKIHILTSSFSLPDSSIINEDKIWNFARAKIADVCKQHHMEPNLVEKHTLNYYFKKFFEYDLLMQRSDNVVRKLPLLFVYVKEVTRLGDNATLVVSDGNEKVIHSKFQQNN